MPKAYVICFVDITEPEAYDRYRAAAGPLLADFAGTYLARGGHTEVLEGDSAPQRVVLIEFPDAAAARAWYDSPGYTAARELRAGAARTSFVLVEGA